MVISTDNVRGFSLALSSSVFIGSSFIIKKIGLKKASSYGISAGSGGFSYLYEPLWWLGMVTSEFLNFVVSCIPILSDIIILCTECYMLRQTKNQYGYQEFYVFLKGNARFSQYLSSTQNFVTLLFSVKISSSWAHLFLFLTNSFICFFLLVIVGEVANFAAYAFAPAILVTPLGALSVIVSAVLAHFVLDEKLHIFGVLGCVLCVVGSTSIVLHAPQEKNIESVKEVWDLATEPGSTKFICQRDCNAKHNFHFDIRSAIWSNAFDCLCWHLLIDGLFDMGIALKLTFSGMNQFVYAQTWFFTVVVITCCLFQLNYLNKALDTFNTAVISPVYYVMFTTLTIFASMIMFKDWSTQNASQIVTELCGFITILSGTFLLHMTKDMGNPVTTEPTRLTERELSNHH
ncbi:hypothetical protein ZIOFF_020446 [Zingiber officinale]|uniref:Probable magnesium transporter n=1 Tax=Zingiber officinale TaxID=94328 RepID=A0A8J5LFM8_ZINOF|nr:hypothetical protein ZIOFF_020446 [Zingiber officinale]